MTKEQRRPLAGPVSIVAALSLADIGTLRRYLDVRRSSLAISLVATAGVVFFGVLESILVAVAHSILLFFKRSWWPHGEVLGQIEGHEGWHSVSSAPTAKQRPGVLVYRWEAPLFFANGGMFRQQIRSLVCDAQPSWVLVQCEAITDIDVTAADMLQLLDTELNAQGIHLAFVELRGRLHDLVYRYGLFQTLDRDHFYNSIDESPCRHRGDGPRRQQRLTTALDRCELESALILIGRARLGFSRSSRVGVRPRRRPLGKQLRAFGTAR